MDRIIDLNQYKLIISDIDGTILKSHQPLEPFTKQVIFEIRERGILFTLASGRSLPGARFIAEELAIDLPMVLSNGCIVESLDGNILHRELMPVSVTKNVIEISEERGCDLVLFVDDRLVFKKMTENIEPVFGHIPEATIEVGSWESFFDQLSTVNKCMVLDRSANSEVNLLALENVYAKEFTGEAEYYRTGIHHLEVMPKGVTKALGLCKIAESLGIRLEEIMAFGDYDNDAAMLAAAGLGVAVSNATENVKRNADIIIGSCQEDAPAHFLKDLLDKMK